MVHLLRAELLGRLWSASLRVCLLTCCPWKCSVLCLSPPLPTTVIHTPPMLEDTAAIAYTRQRATLALANMIIAIHITDTAAPDELVYVFAYARHRRFDRLRVRNGNW